ncbi:MAG: diadenylate cyclase CdaA [Planctomycetota bacterium]
MNLDLDRLWQLWNRVQGHWEAQPVQVAIELAIIWLAVYVILRFLRGTRGARIIKAVLLILFIGTLAVQILARGNQFARLGYLYENFLTIAALILVVVFQPELRRALVRLGEARLFRVTGVRKQVVTDELVKAMQYMSRNKIGALIAIERQVGLRGIIELGTPVGGEVTAALLQTIFWPGSALHDMGVIVRNDRIIAAGVQFPLAEGESIPQELGSRHRAAIGLSQESDAIVLVVSEETGTISIAERGQLRRNLTPDELRPILTRNVGTAAAPADDDAPAFDENPPEESASRKPAAPKPEPSLS